MSLAALRADLAHAIDSPEWDTHRFVPDVIEPPCVIVQPGDPYLTPVDSETTYAGPTEHEVTVQLWALSPLDGGEDAIDAIDAMTEYVLARIPEGWWLDESGVGQPDAARIGDALFYGLAITCHTYITIDKETRP